MKISQYLKKRFLLALSAIIFLVIIIGAFLWSEKSLNAAGLPAVTVPASQNALLGSDFTFNASFSNSASSNPGFGPYIDLIFPVNGYDGQAGSSTPDGISFVSASFLGTNPVVTTLTFPDDDGSGPGTTGTINHPYAVDNTGVPVHIIGTAGDKLVVVQLPFGSFIPSQTPADVSITAHLSNLADIGAGPLQIKARGGFQFGDDEFNNPSVDPSTIGSQTTLNVTPTLFTVTKTQTNSGEELVSGPNDPGHYAVHVDFADGFNYSNVVVTDNLANKIQYQGGLTSTPSASTILGEPATTSPQNAPNNQLSLKYNSIVGGVNEPVNVGFDFFMPLKDANAADVIPETTGGCISTPNNIDVAFDFTPIDSRDASAHFDSSAGDMTHKTCALDIQKSVAIVTDNGPAGTSPGDIVEYTLAFSVSDYFALNGINISDVLGDGLRFQDSYTPTLAFNRPNTITAGLDASNFTVGTPSLGDGTQNISFRVSDELLTRGLTDKLLGACVQNGGSSPDCSIFNNGTLTRGTIKFRAVIQQAYSVTGPGTLNIDQGDSVTNNVSISGNVLNDLTLIDTGNDTTDTSAVSLTIAKGDLAEKSVYAVNGSTSPTSPVRVKPGDAVTYRYTYTFPTGDVDNLKITDFVPLPVFDASEITTFDTAAPSADVPAPGTIKYGPTDTFSGLTGLHGSNPVFTATGGSMNTLLLDYGHNETASEGNYTIDVLFTLTVSDKPFADGLLLTNTATAAEKNTPGSADDTTKIVQIMLEEPNLKITKGVVATDHASAVFSPATVGPVNFSAPGTAGFRASGTINSTNLLVNPIQSDLSGIDAGDKVTFAIVVENTGSSLGGAFNVKVKDVIPAGFSAPGGGLNLKVTDGAGNLIGTTAVNGADANPLIENGIILNDGVTGSIATATGNLVSGANIAIITYDLQANSTIEAQSLNTNAATLFSYASVASGTNFIADPLIDSATVTTSAPTVSKTTAATTKTVGAQFDYQVTVTVPEGRTSNLSLVDTLPTGLAYVHYVSATSSSGAVTTDLAGGFNSACNDGTASGTNNPLITATGQVATYNLGTITNTDTDNATPETITLTYSVIVEDVAGNTVGTTLRNSVNASWLNGSVRNIYAPNVTVILPILTINKTLSASTGDAGDTVGVTLTLAHGGTSTSDAYDVSLTDAIPSGFTYAGGSLNCAGGTQTPDTCTESGGTITADWSTNPFVHGGGNAVITFNMTVDPSVSMSQSITNTGSVTYTSVSGVVSNPSPYVTTDTERTSTASNSKTFTVNGPVPVKSVATSSEAFTTVVAGTENVAIGEIVRFRLLGQLSEGTTGGLRFTDNLPANLQFINDGTAKVAFVSTGGTMSSNTLVPATIGCNGGANPSLNVVGDNTTIASTTPTCALPSSAITGGPFVTGTDPKFDFGNVTNDDSDADKEYVVVEFNALVLNTSTANSGNTLSNTFTVYKNLTTSLATSAAVNLRVAEPAVSISKTVTSSGPYDAGNTVTYSLVVTNTATGNSGADAFELAVADAVDNHLTVTGVILSGVPSYATSTNTSAGNNIAIALDTLHKGDSFTVTVNATVNATDAAGLIINNQATVTYTSLPGTNGTTGNATGSDTPGASGSGTGERDGSGLTTAPDDLYSIDNTGNSITLAVPTIDKQTPAVTQYTIGAPVTYNILVTLPEGVTKSLKVVDAIPAGMKFTGATVVSTATGSPLLAADFNGILATPTITSAGGSGDAATLDFGDTTAVNDNVTNNNAFVVRVSGVVMNVAGNQDGATLTNSATLTYTNPNTLTTATVTDATPAVITVIEPVLDISKTISVLPSPAQAGKTVRYSVTISHNASSHSAAYDVSFADTLPAVFQDISIVSVTGNGIANPSSGISGQRISVPSAGTFDLPLSTSVTIVFEAVINNSINPGQVVTNTGRTIWSSLSGASADERTDGAGAPDGLNLLGGGALNDYEVQSSVDFTANIPTLLKTINNTSVPGTTGSDVAIGETVSYSLNVPIIEGTTPSLSIVDNVPSGMAYILGSLAINSSSFSGSLPTPTITATGGNGSPISISYGAVSNPTDGNTADDFITVTFNLRVLDVAGNHGLTPTQTVLTNSATINSGTGPVTSNSVDATVVEPNMTIAKSFSASTAAANDTLLVTLTVGNTGTTDAYDVNLSDAIPAGMTYAGNLQRVSGLVPTTLSQSSGTVSAAWNSFAAAGSCVITFNVAVDADASHGAVINNSASLSNITTLPGSDANERIEPVKTASSSVTIIAPDLAVTKTRTSGVPNPGDIIIYQLNVRNIGDKNATGVVLTETVPAGSTFNAANSAAGWSCSPDNNPGSTCTLAIGAMAVSASTNKAFALTVFDPASVSGQIVNTATVDNDGTHGADYNTANNTSSNTTTINGSAVITAAKADSLFTDADNDGQFSPGDTILYTVVIKNSGNHDAGSVVFSDTPGANTTLVAGSVTTTLGAVTAGNTAGNTTIGVSLGTLAGENASSTVTFKVTVANPVPSGVTSVANQGTVSGSNFTSVHTDDPDTVAAGDTTVTPLHTYIDLVVTKTANISSFHADDVIVYTLNVVNNGNVTATGVTLTDTLPANNIAFTSASNGGSDTSGTVSWPAFTLAGAGSSTVRTVTTRVSNPVSVSKLTNIAAVTDDGANGTDINLANNNASLDIYAAGGSRHAPANLSLVINGGAACTADRNVSVALGATDADHYLLSNNGAVSGNSWQAFTYPITATVWDLGSGDGLKTVYAKFSGPANAESDFISATIMVDSANRCGSAPTPAPTPNPNPTPNPAPVPTPIPTPIPAPIPSSKPSVNLVEIAGAQSCSVKCQQLAYDLYIVNPDGSERHMNTRWAIIQSRPDGTNLIRFEDKGNDFDYNDVNVIADTRNCDSLQFTLQSVNASWHHQLRLTIFNNGVPKNDYLLAADTHDSLGADIKLDVSHDSALCTESLSCAVACADLDIALTLTNPDGTVRVMNSKYAKIENRQDGSQLIRFEDKGVDFDYNDVTLLLDRKRCDDVRVTLVSTKAAWHHKIGVLVRKDGKDVLRRTLWADSHIGVGNTLKLNLKTDPEACQSIITQNHFTGGPAAGVTLFSASSFRGASVTLFSGSSVSNLSLVVDPLKSIKTFGGGTAILYAKAIFQGASRVVGNSNADLSANIVFQPASIRIK
jgi:uncharacterized repeat protein (TIGR01451 family)/fimbrial isopeptide formation D2 family protein